MWNDDAIERAKLADEQAREADWTRQVEIERQIEDQIAESRAPLRAAGRAILAANDAAERAGLLLVWGPDGELEPASPWYDLEGHYYASASDAAFARRLQRERRAREAARRADYLARQRANRGAA